MKDYYTPKRKGIGGWFAFLWGGWGARSYYRENICLLFLTELPFCAGVTGPDFLHSTGEVRSSELGLVTIIFR